LTNTSPSNVGSLFVTLTPWSDREAQGESIESILAKVRGRVSTIQEAMVRVFMPAPVRGLSRTGGFELQLEDRAGGSVQDLAALAQRFVERARTRPERSEEHTSELQSR